VEPLELTVTPLVVTEAPLVVTEAPLVVTEAPLVVTEAPLVTTDAPEIQATPISIFGIEGNRLTSVEISNASETLGSRWIRRNGALWSRIEPVEGERNWNSASDLEAWLSAVSADGFEPILIVRSTPDWAQHLPGYSCGPVKEEKIEAFANFMHDLVARYSRPPYNVRYWEIWNEPDASSRNMDPESVYGCWGDPEDKYYGGRDYGQVLQAVYPRIKAADPEAQVLIGGLLLDCDPNNPPIIPNGPSDIKDCTSSRFLEGVLKSGAADSFDGVSYHAYDFYLAEMGKYGNLNWASTSDTTGPSLIAKANYIQDLLDEAHLSGKFIMNTETALLCNIPGDEQTCSSSEFERTKADYLVQSYVSASQLGLKANIWYSYFGWRSSGLVDGNRDPLPAYYAYLHASRQLGEARYTRAVDLAEGLQAHWFTSETRIIWVIWAESRPVAVTLPVGLSAISDTLGNPLLPDRELVIDTSPVYVFWELEG
jgi:hypothetical protein